MGNSDLNNQIPSAASNRELPTIVENFKTLKLYDIPAGDFKRRQELITTQGVNDEGNSHGPLHGNFVAPFCLGFGISDYRKRP
ncbi:unnamed protein product [Penicillium camemberti]|uniref:Str. FM013 n=1 Tax=Penicillium camemberti (strain FM 013) TaxID=1429867 RepID=A0A0G4P4N1_PENC3|nr:unnamed protein product [Penicillium camemberti]